MQPERRPADIDDRILRANLVEVYLVGGDPVHPRLRGGEPAKRLRCDVFHRIRQFR